MKQWFRKFLLALTIGGGFTGLVVTAEAMFQQKDAGLSFFMLSTGCGLVYLLILLSGLSFADNRMCTWPVMLTLVIQIPWLSSPLLSYYLTAGLSITVGIAGGKFGATWYFGSNVHFTTFGHHPWGVGINLVALLALIGLMRYRQTPNTALI